MSVSVSFSEAVARAKAVHGDRYTYHSEGYTTAAGFITLTCPIHGKFQMRPADHWKGHGCKECGKVQCVASKRGKGHEHLAKLKLVHPTYEFPNYLENFTTVTAKIPVVCPVHGEFTASTHHLKRGKGCRVCGAIKSGVSRKWSAYNLEDRLRKSRPDSPYVYHPETFTDYCEHITITCPIHGDFRQTPEAHNQGAGCKICASRINSLKASVSSDELLRRCRKVHGDKYEYAKPLAKVASKWEITCPTHGVFKQLGYAHIRGSKCPSCANTGSAGQRELLELVKSIYPDAISDYRFSRTSKQQIDVYIPSLKMGFEYDGIYWHSSANKPDKYHLDKQNAAKAEDITLYQIFSDEWARPAGKKLVLQRITTSKGIPARKCKVVEIPAVRARAFHNENHIQGSKLSGRNFALEYLGDIVAVMTFTNITSVRGEKPKQGHMELARYSTAARVVGGASKLFSYAIKSLGLEHVISYSDNRLFDGGMYEKLGFSKAHVTPPNYSYCAPNNSVRLHKSHFRHSKLPTLLGSSYNPAMTERENCEAAGYYQVYDCGLTKWVWQSTT